MTWHPHLSDVLGVWQKRDCAGDRFECRGSVKVSGCGTRYLFIPHDKKLYPVEAVLG